jgi:hypothetical protein
VTAASANTTLASAALSGRATDATPRLTTALFDIAPASVPGSEVAKLEASLDPGVLLAGGSAPGPAPDCSLSDAEGVILGGGPVPLEPGSRGFLVSDFVGQIRNGITPLAVRASNGAIDWGASISAIVSMVAVISGLVYFFFSKEHKGLFGRMSRLGVWVLMVSFGAGFGYTVMGRIALLVGRFEFLLYDWLQVGSR